MFGGKLGNIASLMKNAGKIQEMMQQAQEELAKLQVTGEAGAGMVVATVNGQNELIKLDISDEAMKESKDILTDLIVAAVNNANAKAKQISQEKMMAAGGGMLGGMEE